MGDTVDPGAPSVDGSQPLNEISANEDAADSGLPDVNSNVRTAPSDAVVLAVNLLPQTLNPYEARAQADITYLSMVYDRLLELSNNLDVVPMLASGWEYVDKGSAVDLTLRDDVEFLDGTPFNAAAVVANISYAKASQGSMISEILSVVETVEEIDSTHVRFHLNSSVSSFPAILAGPAGIMISPDALSSGLDLGQPGVKAGTGVFYVESWEPGEKIVYQPVADHWDSVRQRYQETQIIYQPSEVDRMSGLQGGAYDVVSVQGDSVTDALVLAEQGEYRHLEQHQNSIYGLLLNPTDPTLGSPEIRQAIQYAIDRNDIVDQLMKGTCESRSMPFPLGSNFYFPELEARYRYDPDEARRLVAASGVENPTFELLAPPGVYKSIASRIKDHLSEVGIKVNLIEVGLSDAASRWASGDVQAASYFMPGLADPAVLLGVYLRNSNWESVLAAAVGDSFGQAEALPPGDPMQVEAYRQILSEVNDLGLFVPACSVTSVWIWRDDIYGVDIMPNLWSGLVLPYTLRRGES